MTLPLKQIQAPGFVLILSGSTLWRLYVCNGTDNIVLHDSEKKMQLTGLTKLQRIDFSPYSIFEGHGYL